MRTKAVVLLGIALCLAAPLAVRGQKFLPKAIQLKGAPLYSDEELLAAAELKKGVVLNYADMNAHAKKLMDTGMFSTLAFKFDGVDLVFSLTPSDSLLKAHFDNIPLGSAEDIETALHKQLPLYHGQVPTDGGYAELVRATLEQMLAARGLQSTVAAVPVGDPTHRGPATMMSYAITTPRVLAGPVTVEGASAQWASKVNDLATAAGTVPYDAENSTANVARPLEQFYQDHGYAAVRVKATRRGDASLDDKGIHVPFAVTVEEGHPYAIGTIRLPAGTPVTQAEVDKLLTGKIGPPEPGIRLRGLWMAVAARFKSKGYLDVKVTPKPQFDEAAAKVNYDVTIETGPVYHLAFVKFEGVSDELRALLIKNWQMMPGDPFDENYAATFVGSAQAHDPILQRTLAGVATRFYVTADPQTHDVNVVIRFSK